MVQSGALSEPEGECSSCSSYEYLSSNSEIDEIIQEEELSESKNRKNSDSYTSTSYSSWYLRRRSSTKHKIESTCDQTESKESLTVTNGGQKNWWYWMKLAVFMASPFIARQLGIIVGKRILSRTFKSFG